MENKKIKVSLTTFTWINFGLVALALCSAVFMIGRVRGAVAANASQEPENQPSAG